MPSGCLFAIRGPQTLRGHASNNHGRIVLTGNNIGATMNAMMLAWVASVSVGFTGGAKTYTVDGVVIESTANSVIADAAVIVRDVYGGEIATATTDKQGVYHASFVSSASNPTVTVEINRAGFVGQTFPGQLEGLGLYPLRARLLCAASPENTNEVGCLSYDDVARLLAQNGSALTQQNMLDGLEGIGELAGANGIDTMVVIDHQGGVVGVARPTFDVATGAMTTGAPGQPTLHPRTFVATITPPPTGLSIEGAGLRSTGTNSLTPLYSNDIYRDINCDEGRGYWTKTTMYGLPDNRWCEGFPDEGICVGCCDSGMSTCTGTALALAGACAAAAGWTPWAIACVVGGGAGLGLCKYWNNSCVKGCRKNYKCCVAPDGSRLYNYLQMDAAQVKRKEWAQQPVLVGGWGFRWCQDKVFLNSQQGEDFVWVELNLANYMATHGYQSHWELSFGREGDMILEARVKGLYDVDTDTYVVTDVEVREDRYVDPEFVTDITKTCGETIDVYRALP